MNHEQKNFDALIQYRVQQALEAIDDAEFLLHAKRYRASVNRIYYACFYAATAALLSKRMQYSKHTAIIANFDRHFIKSGLLPRDYSKTLHLAFNERQEDDYKPFAEPEPELVQNLSSQARQMVLGVRDFLLGQLE